MPADIKPLGWFVVNLTDEQRGACPGILIFANTPDGPFDGYYPDIQLTFDEVDGRFYVDKMTVACPGIDYERGLVVKLFDVLESDPDTFGDLVNGLRSILVEGEIPSEHL